MIRRVRRWLGAVRKAGVSPVRLAAQADTADAEAAAQRWAEHADSYAREAQQARQERDRAYRERAALLAWLAALHPASTVITLSRTRKDWLALYLVAGGWQLSWQIHPDDAELFAHVLHVPADDPRAQWDGHGPAQRHHRIRQHTRLLSVEGQLFPPSAQKEAPHA